MSSTLNTSRGSSGEFFPWFRKLNQNYWERKVNYFATHTSAGGSIPQVRLEAIRKSNPKEIRVENQLELNFVQAVWQDVCKEKNFQKVNLDIITPTSFVPEKETDYPECWRHVFELVPKPKTKTKAAYLEALVVEVQPKPKPKELLDRADYLKDLVANGHQNVYDSDEQTEDEDMGDQEDDYDDYSDMGGFDDHDYYYQPQPRYPQRQRTRPVTDPNNPQLKVFVPTYLPNNYKY